MIKILYKLIYLKQNLWSAHIFQKKKNYSEISALIMAWLLQFCAFAHHPKEEQVIQLGVGIGKHSRFVLYSIRKAKK